MSSAGSLAKPSNLEAIVQRIATKGARFAPIAPGSLFLLAGLGLLSIGLFLAASIVLPSIDPYYYFVLPRCPGNPKANLAVAGCIIALGTILTIMGRIKHDNILVSDRELIITRRSGQHTRYAWHEIETVYSLFNTHLLLQLKNGRLRLIPAAAFRTAWRLDMVFLLPVLLSRFLTSQRPELSLAFRRLKSELVGPGISLPIGNPTQQDNRQRGIHIYAFAAKLACVMVVAGWMGTIGPVAGALPIVLAALAERVSRRGPRMLDAVTVTRQQLHITRAGLELNPVPVECIKSMRMSDEGVLVSCFDKAMSLEVHLDPRSAKAMIELVKIGSQMPGLRIVGSPQKVAA